MTVTPNLRPDVEAELLAQAQRADTSLEDYLLSVVEGVVLPPASRLLSPEQRAAAFEAWSAHHRITAALSDDAVSREAMYEGRDV